jgi:aspartyl-tRNA(Asn)/glutamyl-tRNA(Gln) amidotransferase subunit C
MVFNVDSLEHLARLARIDIDVADQQKYAGQIAAILAYFEKLNSVSTANVEPLDFVTELKNIWREDAAKQIFSQDKVLAEAPALKDGQVVVPRILSKS